MEKEQNAVMLKDEGSVGAVRIAETVVAHIASIAASEVEGVVLPGASVAKASKAVKIEVKNKTVKVDMIVSVKYGFNIPEVSGQLQTKVKSAVESMTGLTCAGVNVRFSSVIIK